MRVIACSQCGSPDLTEFEGYEVCDFCKSKFMKPPEVIPAKDTNIHLRSDVDVLLGKCETDPANRHRYVTLILDIDPTNQQVKKYFGQGKQ